MVVINQNGELIHNVWHTLPTLPATLTAGHWLITPEQWQTLRQQPLVENVQWGLILNNTETVTAWRTELAHFALILLQFPKFTDGRAYSQARQLRQVLGYQGEIRASGEVLRDQLWFMARCGFDSFVLQSDAVIAECKKALSEISAAGLEACLRQG